MICKISKGEALSLLIHSLLYRRPLVLELWKREKEKIHRETVDSKSISSPKDFSISLMDCDEVVLQEIETSLTDLEITAHINNIKDEIRHREIYDKDEIKWAGIWDLLALAAFLPDPHINRLTAGKDIIKSIVISPGRGMSDGITKIDSVESLLKFYRIAPDYPVAQCTVYIYDSVSTDRKQAFNIFMTATSPCVIECGEPNGGLLIRNTDWGDMKRVTKLLTTERMYEEFSCFYYRKRTSYKGMGASLTPLRKGETITDEIEVLKSIAYLDYIKSESERFCVVIDNTELDSFAELLMFMTRHRVQGSHIQLFTGNEVHRLKKKKETPMKSIETTKTRKYGSHVLNYLTELGKNPVYAPVKIYKDLTKWLTVENAYKLLRILSRKRGVKLLLGIWGIQYLLDHVAVVKDTLRNIWANLPEGLLKNIIRKVYKILHTINSSVDSLISYLVALAQETLKQLKKTAVKTKEGLMSLLGFKTASEKEILEI